MERPNYYAIIPASVRYDKRLNSTTKLLYGEITSLSNKEGFCWASNSYFAELYDVVPHTISKLISQLAQCGYITIELTYKEDSKQVDQRIIKITDAMSLKGHTMDEKGQGGMDKKGQDNNTRGLNNKYNISCPSEGHRSDSPINPDLFNKFWKEYGKPNGKVNTIKHWNKLDVKEHQLIINSLTAYLSDRPDKKYRKDPERYIKDKVYLDYQDKPKSKFKDYV